jgi:sulfur carrier protein
MRVRVNGQDAQLETGTSLERLVASYRLKPEQVVIELNRKVPAKAAWASTFLAEGDEVEIVKFLGGG